MNKQIMFSLLLIATATINGMKRPNNFQNSDVANTQMVHFNDDVIPQITEYLCISNNYRPCGIRTDIRALYETNKSFHNYYAQEKNQQDIIRCCSQYRKSNDRNIARDLKCHAVHAKIKRYTDIAHNRNLQFSENDLKETWYLNMTTTLWTGFLKKSVQQSLLQVAFNHSDAKKVIQIIDHAKKLDFYYSHGYSYEKNLLSNIAQTRKNSLMHTNGITDRQYDDLLEIAKRLLQKNILPDGRETIRDYTPLMYAVEDHDKELTQLLLEYGADPYAELYDIFAKKMINTFDFEPEKGWLQKIIDEVEKNKKTI